MNFINNIMAKAKASTTKAVEVINTDKIRWIQIEKIEIDYTIEHHSAFGMQRQEHKCVYKPQFEAFFIISCIHRECSSIGFDLGNEIFSMWHSRQEEMSGEKKCQGQEAPDHPEQSCS